MHAVLAATGSLDNLKTWLGSLVGIACIVSGVMITFRAHNGSHSSALRGVGVLLIGLLVVGLSHGNNANNVENWLDSLFIS